VFSALIRNGFMEILFIAGFMYIFTWITTIRFFQRRKNTPLLVTLLFSANILVCFVFISHMHGHLYEIYGAWAIRYTSLALFAQAIAALVLIPSLFISKRRKVVFTV
jgi:hypothetical protein